MRCIYFSSSCKSVCMRFFWLSNSSLCQQTHDLCVFLKMHTAHIQIEMSLWLQWSSHIFKECFWHFLVDEGFSNGITLCSLGWSEICFHSHVLQRYVSQASQYKGGNGISQRWHHITSWKLHSVNMVKHLCALLKCWKHTSIFVTIIKL